MYSVPSFLWYSVQMIMFEDLSGGGGGEGPRGGGGVGAEAPVWWVVCMCVRALDASSSETPSETPVRGNLCGATCAGQPVQAGRFPLACHCRFVISPEPTFTNRGFDSP